MVKVKTLKAHSNGYGKTFNKKKGDEYEHPAPAALIKSGLVSEVGAKPEKADPPAGGNDPEKGDKK